MKQQIAGFLGELAEELGWTPELEQARVREETTQPESMKSRNKSPVAVTPDPEDPGDLTSPVERLRAELEQLRSTVKHLGSEVIYLRGQLAKMRNLPVPPDAGGLAPSSQPAAEPAPTAPRAINEDTATAPVDTQPETATANAVPAASNPEGAGRRWPRLFHRGAAEDRSTDETIPAAETPPVATSAATDAAPTASGHSASAEPEGPTEPTGPAVSEEAVGTAAAAASEAPVRTPPVSPTVVDVGDDEDSALELFPSEPSSQPEGSSSKQKKRQTRRRKA